MLGDLLSLVPSESWWALFGASVAFLASGGLWLWHHLRTNAPTQKPLGEQ